MANGEPCERALERTPDLSIPQTIAGGVTRVRGQNVEPATSRGRLRPEPQAVTDVAGDAFCHAELRVCGIDRSGVRSRAITARNVATQRVLHHDLCP